MDNARVVTVPVSLYWKATGPIRRVAEWAQPYLMGMADPVFYFQGEKGPGKKSLRLTEDLANVLLRGVFFPGLLNHLDGPTRPIFRKLWKDRTYVPTPKEEELLRRYGHWEWFQARKKFLNEHEARHKIRKGLAIAGDAAVKLAYVLSGNLLVQELQDGGPVSADDYMKTPQYAPDDGEVQLLIDSVPFPHLAIRIGDRVYSYGYTHLIAMPASSYFFLKDIREALRQNPGLFPEGEEADESGIEKFVGDMVAKADLPRTLQVITLKLGKERRDQVKQYLEDQVGKRYANKTFVNDCATMVMRALGMKNMFYDTSPSGIAMLFALRKSFGDKSVVRIQQVSVERPEQGRLYLLRNAYINLQDVLVHIHPLNYPVTRVRRLLFDAARSPDEIQYFDDEIRDFLAEFRPKFLKSLDEDDELTLIRERAKEAHGMPPGDPKRKALAESTRRLSDSYFKEKLEEAKLEYEQSPDVRRKDRLFAQFKLQLLPMYQDEVNELLK